MIHIKYTALFEIDFIHDYYTDKKCNDIIITPSPSCSILLRQMGLKFMQTATGCKVFAKVNESGNKNFVKTDIPENSRFSFLLLLQNPQFYTFSLLDLDLKEKQHFYFNNLISNTSVGNTPNLVKDLGTKKVTDADLLHFERNTYQFKHNNNSASQTGEIRFTDTGEKLSDTLNNNNNLFNFSFDLKKASGGRAGFFIENANVDNFYVIDEGSRPDVFGVIEIFHRAGLPDTYRFLNNDKSVATKKYKIAFANRQTTWRYIINKKFNAAVTDIKIKKANGNVIDFTKQAGTSADQFILSSNDAVPLKQQTVTGIRMSDQNDKEIIAHLPNPSLGFLKEEGNKIFSDIFITI